MVEIRKVVDDKAASLKYLERVYESIPDEDQPNFSSNYETRKAQIEGSADDDASTRYDALVNFLSLLYENRAPYQEVEGEGISVPANGLSGSQHLPVPEYSPATPGTPAPVLPETPLPSPESSPSGVHEPYTRVPEVTSENLERAVQALNSADQLIRSSVHPRLRTLKQSTPSSDPKSYDYKVGLAALDQFVADQPTLDPDRYLPLMTKESRLKPEIPDGLFQITNSAQAEVKKYFGYELSDAEKNNPTKNAVAGLLYMTLGRHHYGEESRYSSLSPDDKTLLTYAIFNKGPTQPRMLWDKIKPATYEAFETALSKELAMQLASPAEPAYKESEDPEYNVKYREYAGITAYLKIPEPRATNPQLIAAFTLNGVDTGMTRYQVAVMLRYARVIEGIDRTCQMGAATALPEAPEATWKTYTVKAGDGLWSIGRKVGVSVNYLRSKNGLPSDAISVGQVLRVPKVPSGATPYLYQLNGESWITVSPGKGFYTTLVSNETYNSYLLNEIQLTKEQIQEVIIDFNRRYNIELSGINDDASNIPQGAQIWIPNVDYFIAYYKGQLDAPEEAAGLPPIEAPTLPEEVPDLPLPPDVTSEVIGENLDKNTIGQYVRRSGSGWVRDLDAMRRGAQTFATRKWDQHPEWKDEAQNRTLFGGKVELEDVRFIVLHSTASETSASTVNERKAHFVVEKNGEIRYLVPVSKGVDGKYKIPPHAGKSAWGGVSDLNEHSIGIEVVAPDGQDWTDAQYAAMKQLVGWLGGYYGLKQRDVVMHKQVAYSRYGRGRKSDPYGNPETMYARLGLPDNSDILDLEVARGAVASNIEPIQGKEYGHRYGAWTGLDAALYVQTKGPTASPTRPPRVPAEITRWKQEIREKATIVSHTVKAGDTLYALARQYKTHVEIIMAYNDLTNSTLSIGQVLQIPVPKEQPATPEPVPALGSLENPVFDSQMTRDQALQNLTTACPEDIRENQALVSVKYYGFDGKVHSGQLVVDKRLQSDVQQVFQVILATKFPVASVVPIADPRFNWSDDASMAANNTSGFNYRNVPGTSSLSKHAQGFAIDLNTKLNPYIDRAGKVSPPGATYNTSVPGTLTAEHPVVKKFKALGWGWGGEWSNSKDYQHFEKVPA